VKAADLVPIKAPYSKRYITTCLIVDYDLNNLYQVCGHTNSIVKLSDNYSPIQ
jgi:hypothetical protein